MQHLEKFHPPLALCSARMLLRLCVRDTVHIYLADLGATVVTVAHKQVEARDNFSMVGAYPKGAPSWDCFKGEGGETEWREAMATIKKIRMPETDPVFGTDPRAPMFEHWQSTGS